MIHPHSGPCSGQGLFCAPAPRSCILLLCLALFCLLSSATALRAAPTEAMLMPAPASVAKSMVPPVLLTPNSPLLPRLQYFIDHTGTMDVEEVAAPANASAFQPLQMKALPRTAGIMWLRFTLAPLPQGIRPGAMLLDMGASVPDDPVLYEPRTNPLTDAVEWREIIPSQRDVLLLPEAGNEPLTCYIRLDGLPGLWFEPMLRTPQDAANNWGSLAGTAAVLALAVVMLLCLLRGLSEKGQWRIWTALYVGAALAQAIMGVPAYGSGHITLMEAAAVLSPGVALMLLPHVGRHLLRTKGRSRLLDMQFVLLSLPGAALALLPLLPGFGWLIRYLALWPLCTLIFVPSAVGGAVMGLGGARRFLLGCLLPPAFVVAGVLGLDSGYAANLMASAPLWGTALSALIIAGTGAPRDMAHDAAAREGRKKEKSLPGLDGAGALSASKGAGKGAVRKSADAPPSMDDGVINLDQPLDDPNLRLLPPAPGPDSFGPDRLGPDSFGPDTFGPGGLNRADAHAPLGTVLADDPAWTQDYAQAPAKAKNSLAGADTCLWESALRPPLERLLREGAALGHCALPPAVRQYAENMLEAAADMAHALDNPGKGLDQSRIGETRSPFNLQYMVREAHDAVSAAAENAGVALAWYMPPLLGHMYEGQAHALRETLALLLESAVRATSRGAVHLSVRRVPESADPGHLLFTVTDTGTGIPPRNRSTLALARAWELAGTNNCYLNVECTPQGTSISFTLRLKPLEHDAGADEELRPHVAVVAEKSVERQSVAHMVAAMGLSSTEARTLREALELNRENPALLLVVHAPAGGSGDYGLLERFKDQAAEAGLPFCKALAITSDDSQWDTLADTGYTHALLEPVDKTAFGLTVQEILAEADMVVPDSGPDAEEDAEEGAAQDTDHQPPSTDFTAASPAASEDARPDNSALPPDTLDGPEDAVDSPGLPTPLPAEAIAAATPSSPLPDLFGTDQEWSVKNTASSQLPDLTALPQLLGLADQLGGGLPPNGPGMPLVSGRPAAEVSPGTADTVAATSADLHITVPTADDEVLLPQVAPLFDQSAPDQPVSDLPDLPAQPDLPPVQEVPDIFGADTGMDHAAGHVVENVVDHAPDHVPDHAPDHEPGRLAATAAQADRSADRRDSAEPPLEAVYPVEAAESPSAAPESPAAESPVPQPSDAPATEKAAESPGDSADFIASAGLEGPIWGGEVPAHAEAAVSDGQAGAVAGLEQEAGAAPVAVPADAPPSAAPEHAENTETAGADNPAAAMHVAGASSSGMQAGQSVISVRGRIGEAVLRPVNAPPPDASAMVGGGLSGLASLSDALAAEAPGAEKVQPVSEVSASSADQAAPAGPVPASEVSNEVSNADPRKPEGYLDATYPGPVDAVPHEKLDWGDEWVGEPMPAGTLVVAGRPAPVSSAAGAEGHVSSSLANPDEWVGEAMPIDKNTIKTAKPAPGGPQPAPAVSVGGYVSPSLASPGEWVGEPTPIDKNAIKDARPEPAPRPIPAASERRAIPWPGDTPASQSAAAASRSVKPSSGPREMPHTATGRLIRKLLGSTNDAAPLVENAQEMPRQSGGATRTQGGEAGFRPSSAGRSPADDGSIVDFIAGATPPSEGNGPAVSRVDAPTVSAQAVSGPYVAPAAPDVPAASGASGASGTSGAAGASPVPPQPHQQDETLLRMVERLDAAMADAQRAYKGHNCPAVAEASGRIANESDGFGFRVLARMARCVERAARANDMSALRDLLPELAVAVERNRIALNPHHQDR